LQICGHDTLLCADEGTNPNTAAVHSDLCVSCYLLLSHCVTFQLEYRKQVACNVICEKEMIIPGSDKSKNTDKSKMADLKSSQLLMRAIQLNYQQHWLVELWFNI